MVATSVAIRVLTYRRLGVDDTFDGAYASLAPVTYLVPVSCCWHAATGT